MNTLSNSSFFVRAVLFDFNEAGETQSQTRWERVCSVFTSSQILLCLLAFLSVSSPRQAAGQTQWRDFRWVDSFSGPLDIKADSLTTRDDGNHLLFSGNIDLRGKGLSIRAESMEVFRTPLRIIISGSVRIVDGNNVILCEKLQFDKRTSRAILLRSTFLLKTNTQHAQLAQCKTASDLVAQGKNKIRFFGERWLRKEGKYYINQAEFTPCDCGQDESPSWSLSASDADVIPNQRVWLDWPVVYLKGIPAFIFPFAYLPLSERRTGLLMPQANYLGLDGFYLSDSLFITLGDHADMTLALDWIEDRGFRQRLEFRATPVKRSWFRLNLTHISDPKAAASRQQHDDLQRITGELEAFWYSLRGFSLRSEVLLYSDSDIPRDFLSDMAGRATEFAPSSIVFDWSDGENMLLQFDATWRQNLRIRKVSLFASADNHQLSLWQMDPVGDTIQRLGAVSFAVFDLRVFDNNLRFSLATEAANLSSLQAAWRDWGADGTPDNQEFRYRDVIDINDYGADNGLGGEGDQRLSSGELRRAVRFLLEPRLEWQDNVGRFAQLEVMIAQRQFVYLPHGPDAPAESTQGMSIAQTRLSTELSRGYGAKADRIGHVLRPSLTWVSIWQGLASSELHHYLDAQDRLQRDISQAVLELNSRLYKTDGQFGFKPFFDLWVQQGLDMRASRLAQLVVGMYLDIFPILTELETSFDWHRQELAEIDGSVRIYDRRGDYLTTSYLYLPSVQDALGRRMPLSQRTHLEPYLLFGSEPNPLQGIGDDLHVLSATMGLSLFYGLHLFGGIHINIRDEKLNWFGAGLRYKSNCDCWGLTVSFRKLADVPFPDIFFLLDLGILGRAGGGTQTRI